MESRKRQIKRQKKRLIKHKTSRKIILVSLLSILHKVFEAKVMDNKIVKNGMVLTPFEQLEDEWFGEKGTASREQYDLELKLDLIGEALKAARKRRKLTQEELGQLVGVGKAQISKLEKSTGNTTVDTVLRVFTALGATVKLRIELENTTEIVLQ